MFSRAIALDPKFAIAHSGLADCCSYLYLYWIDIDPNLFEAHYFYGRAYLAQGKFKEAIAPLRSACKVRAEDYQAPALLGLAYTGLGRRGAASRAYARAAEVAKQQLSVNPGDVRALYLGAGSLARIGRRKTALAWAARALELDGKDSAVLYNVGCLYAILGRTADALRCLKKVVRSGWRKEWIKHDPDLNALRGLREFAALVS
jgi:adenylate cyclase